MAVAEFRNLVCTYAKAGELDISPMAVKAVYSSPGFYIVTFSCTITNRGSEAQKVQLVWGTNYWAPWYEEEVSRIINLEPGQTYPWSWEYEEEVYDYYRGYFTCWLYVEGIEVKGVWK